jgi:mediator of RNA polymerase II transcription subunit 14
VTFLSNIIFLQVHLFDLVDGLEAYLESSSSASGDHSDVLLSNAVGIQTYSFEEVTLEYGPGHKQTVRVRHDAAKGRFKLSFGGQQELSGMCPHSIVKEQLEEHLNANANLALLAKILHETYSPLKSVCRLPNTPQLGVSMQKANHPVETFVTVPQSPTHLKVI